MIAARDITGLVLAGGQDTRMEGVDKGLLPLAGRPLAWHALERLRPQVGTLAISANRNLQDYRGLGVPVWPDLEMGRAAFPGPLGGVLAGLSACPTEWLMVVPCDASFFPQDLVARLAAGITARENGSAPMAVAWSRSASRASLTGSQGAEAPQAKAPALDPDSGRDPLPLRPQPVFCLLHRNLKEALTRFLAEGGQRAGDWARRAGAVRVDFDRPGMDDHAFLNLNQPADFQVAEGLAATLYAGQGR